MLSENSSNADIDPELVFFSLDELIRRESQLYNTLFEYWKSNETQFADDNLGGARDLCEPGKWKSEEGRALATECQRYQREMHRKTRLVEKIWKTRDGSETGQVE
jgi:hypothetical protein